MRNCNACKPALTIAALLFAVVAACASTLDELEARADKARASSDPAGQAELAAITREVEQLVDSDALHSASDFARAAKLVSNPYFKLEPARLRHELTLTAVSLGDEASADQLASTWDDVILATGRERPFGVRKFQFQNGPGERFEVDEAPKCICDVLLAPVQARIRTRDRKDNSEVAKIVDADQKARSDWHTPTNMEEGLRIWREDKARIKRIEDIVEGGGLHTATDFENAALVCQHGSVFADYQLAHELALCAVVLGDGDATWLAGATYDRMMLSASYPQRFATQFLNGNLETVGNDGINDTMRKAVVHVTIEDARRQEQSLREQMLGH
jgi:hypothetical protein